MADRRKKGCINPICKLSKNETKQKTDVNFCPECGDRLVFVCKKCFKEIEDRGEKHAYCDACEVEREQKKQEAVDKAKDVAGKGVKVVAVVAAPVVAALQSEASKKILDVARKLIQK